jgi:hypothetical protein
MRGEIMKIKKTVLLTVSLLLLFSFTLQSEVVATFPELMKPYFMAVDDIQLYVIDKEKIYIYSLTDYKLKTTFGKKGEGPQEFRLSRGGEGLMIFPKSEVLLVNSLGKLSFFTKDGKYLKEIKLPSNMSQSTPMVQTFGKNYVGLGSFVNQKEQGFSVGAILLDEQLQKIKVLTKVPFMKGGKMTFPLTFPAVAVMEDKIITPGESNRFSVYIFDKAGNKTVEISRNYKPLKVNDKYKEDVFKFYKNSPETKAFFEIIKKMLAFDGHFPPIQNFWTADNYIYIQTYLEQDGQYEFFVYDLKGKLVKRLFLHYKLISVLRPNPTAFKNNTCYQLIENEDEEIWELHIQKILN